MFEGGDKGEDNTHYNTLEAASSANATNNEEPKQEVLLQPMGLATLFGIFLCLLGQVFIWIKAEKICNPSCPPFGSQNQIGTYFLFLLVIGIINLISLLKERPELLYVSVTFLIVVADINVCVTHWFFDNNKGQSFPDLLKAGACLAIIGSLITFCVIGAAKSGVAFGTRQIIAIVFAALFILGSILIWSRGHPCTENKYPVYPARPVFLAVWYVVTMVTNWLPGQEHLFLLALISLSDYQPFGPRCDEKTCQAGTAIVFITLLLLIAFHLISDCSFPVAEKGGIAQDALTRLRVNKRGWVVVSCGLLSLVGGILVWAGTEDGKHAQAQEVWDTIVMVIVALLMIFVEATKNPIVAVICMSLLYAVIGRAVSGGGCNLLPVQGGSAPREGIVNHKDGTIRTGYIFLFIGCFACFISLPVNWKLAKELGVKMDEDSRSYILMSIAIICSVIYLWSEEKYFGQLGVTGLVLLISTLVKFPHGYQWVYVVALLQVPLLTPFTTCEANGHKLAVLLCWFVLLAVVFWHYSKFGATAFSDVRLFNIAGGQSGGKSKYDTILDKPSSGFSPATSSALKEPLQGGDSFQYATQQPLIDEGSTAIAE